MVCQLIHGLLQLSRKWLLILEKNFQIFIAMVLPYEGGIAVVIYLR